jgi:cell division protein FtsB
MLVQLQLEINNRKDQLTELEISIQEETTENEALQNQCDNYEKYLEQKAREQGMARPGETYYIIVPGD